MSNRFDEQSSKGSRHCNAMPSYWIRQSLRERKTKHIERKERKEKRKKKRKENIHPEKEHEQKGKTNEGKKKYLESKARWIRNEVVPPPEEMR